jgi:hypothetical protein
MLILKDRQLCRGMRKGTKRLTEPFYNVMAAGVSISQDTETPTTVYYTWPALQIPASLSTAFSAANERCLLYCKVHGSATDRKESKQVVSN